MCKDGRKLKGTGGQDRSPSNVWLLRDPPCVVSSALICSETPLVSAQEIAAARARVCHLINKHLLTYIVIISLVHGTYTTIHKLLKIIIMMTSSTCCMLSTQHGMQAQGQSPTRTKSPLWHFSSVYCCCL